MHYRARTRAGEGSGYAVPVLAVVAAGGGVVLARRRHRLAVELDHRDTVSVGRATAAAPGPEPAHTTPGTAAQPERTSTGQHASGHAKLRDGGRRPGVAGARCQAGEIPVGASGGIRSAATEA